MDHKSIHDYSVANISDDDVRAISQLEKTLSDKTNQDIVLIAYQPNKMEEKTNSML